VELHEAHGASNAAELSRALDVRRVLSWIHDPAFPEEQRRTILMWLHGFSSSEIAAELQISDANVKRLLRAGRQRLRRHFKELP
jgi:DNA-directed RNA polymerase specialized sigma24 family protein